jgi:subtilisin family serine protease
VADAVRSLKRRRDVAYAEPNFVMKVDGLPNDPRFGEEWALRNTGQRVGGVAGTPGEDVHADAAWARTQGSDDVVVAVVDTGVAYDHPDLAPNIWHNPGESGGGREHNHVDDDGNGWIDDVLPHDFVGDDADPIDENGHGTRVAGVIAARGNDGFGMAGMAWHAKVMPMRAMDSQGHGDSATIATAFRDAVTRGAQIVNASLGGPYSEAVADAIGDSPQTLFVTTAGNVGVSVDDEQAQYPCAFTFENLICVGAADADGRLASFSNYGDASVDLVAPGVSVLSPEPTRKTVFEDDFESPLDGRWVSSGTGNQWGRSTLWSASPTHSLADSPAGDHGLHVRSAIQTVQPLDLTGLGDCRLDFTYQNHRAGDSYFYLDAVREGGDRVDLADLWAINSGRYSAVFGDADGEPGVRLLMDFASNDQTGDGLYLDDLKAHCVDPALPATGHGLATGTSFAAPLVAGAAVLRRALHPDESAAMTRAAILQGARTDGRLGGKVAGDRYLDARGALDARLTPSIGPKVGTITTIAGDGRYGAAGDGGPATLASLDAPSGVARLADSSLVFREGYRGRLRKIGSDGIISTLASPDCNGFCPPFPRGDFPEGRYDLDVGMPSPLPDGGFLFTETERDRVRRFAPDGSLSTVASIEQPGGVFAEPDGGFIVSSTDSGDNHRILRRSPTGTTTVLAGGGAQTFIAEGMDARELSLWDTIVAPGPGGDLLLAQWHRIWRVGRDRIVHAIAGIGRPGYSGDGGSALSARVDAGCLYARPGGGILFCDASGRIRLLDTAGRVWTVAGGPRQGFGGDGGPAVDATLDNPAAIAGLPGGGFVFSDLDGSRIRKVASLTLPPDPPGAASTPTPQHATPAPDAAPMPAGAVPRAPRPRAWVTIASQPLHGRARITRVRVRFPARARLTVTCRGGGCPFGRRAFRGQKYGRTLEIRAFRHARLRPGARLTFILHPRHGRAKVARYVVRGSGVLLRR